MAGISTGSSTTFTGFYFLAGFFFGYLAGFLTDFDFFTFFTGFFYFYLFYFGFFGCTFYFFAFGFYFYVFLVGFDFETFNFLIGFGDLLLFGLTFLPPFLAFTDLDLLLDEPFELFLEALEERLGFGADFLTDLPLRFFDLLEAFLFFKTVDLDLLLFFDLFYLASAFLLTTFLMVLLLVDLDLCGFLVGLALDLDLTVFDLYLDLLLDLFLAGLLLFYALDFDLTFYFVEFERFLDTLLVFLDLLFDLDAIFK